MPGLFLLLLSCLIVISLLYWTLKLGIGPTPSSAKVITAIRQCLPDTVNGSVVELGCGWGALLPLLISVYPHHRLIGYERSPVPFYFTACRFRKIDIRKENFFSPDHSTVGLVICYLYPEAMSEMVRDLLPTLPAGCWILSHTFALPGCTPVKTIKAADLYQTPVYLYQKASSEPS